MATTKKRMKTTKVLALAFALLMSVFLVASCGNTRDDSATENLAPDNGSSQQQSDQPEQTGQSGDILNNNSSYFVIIDGTKLSAGDKISDFSSVGFTLKSTEAEEELPAGKYMIGAGNMMNAEDDGIFTVTPFNTGGSSIKLADALVGGYEIREVSAKHDDRSADFEVYGGLKLGASIDDVTKVFGEPSSTSEGIGYLVYRYESDETYRNYKFTFSDEGIVSAIEWQNLVFNE